jgi:hypothetical protein
MSAFGTMERLSRSAMKFRVVGERNFQSQEVEAVRHQYQTLLRITESIAGHRDLSELFHDLAQLLGNVLQFDHLM